MQYSKELEYFYRMVVIFLEMYKYPVSHIYTLFIKDILKDCDVTFVLKCSDYSKIIPVHFYYLYYWNMDTQAPVGVPVPL